jgi:glycosyltransferase involved in cell wall biosynthesis
VKEDLIRYFSLPTEKVVVCPHPISLDWVEKSNEQKIRQVLDKYNLLSQQFILYPAQTWKHKNHLALVKAIALLKPDIDVPKIVCTGKKNNFFTEIEQEIIANQLDDKFLFLDIIPEEELNCLYQACKFVIIPTLYEAGSFPLIESILHGVPVICSDVTSLPQTIGDIRFCFSPHRPIEIADMIGKMLQDANFYTMNKKNSEQRKHELISEKFMTMEKLKFLYQILDEETKRLS